VVPALAGRYHVIRVDLPGCGQSPPAPSYDVPEQAGRVAALLDGLGLGRVTVAGHSSGGYVATALAEQRPGLVGALALISSGPSPGALLAQPVLLRVLLAPPFGPLLWPVRSDAMIRKGMSSVCNLPVDIPDDLVAEVRGIGYRTFRTVLRRNTASSAHQYDTVPNARVEQLPGVGHLPMFEAPEPTSQLLLGFAAAAAGTRARDRRA
jgi:pimeloyl-ACP methyl ester carboxylesterase